MTTARANRYFDLFKVQPQIVINPRLLQGDFETQEQHISPLRPLGAWEACMTLNGSWGYRSVTAKPSQVLIQKMVDVWGKGGNMLMNIGPKADGELPADSVERLRDIGVWLRINGESIYGSTEGPFAFVPWGRSTRKGTTVYLHVFNWPSTGVLSVPLSTPVKRAYLLASRDQALATSVKDNHLLIQLPATAPDANDSVIAVELTAVPPRVDSLALNKPATADSGTNSTALAVDNNPATSWRLAKGATSGNFTVDLQRPQAIAALRVGHPQYARIDAFTLEYRDEETWKTVFTDVNMAPDEYVKTFPELTAQHVRLRITEGSGDLKIGSFELFGP